MDRRAHSSIPLASPTLRSARPAGLGPWLALGLPVLLMVLAPHLAPHAPDGFSLADRLQAPSLSHPLGTDAMGRCVLSRLLHGFAVTPAAAAAVVVSAALIGGGLGLLLGMAGGWVDRVGMRIVDGGLIFPGIALALALSAVLGLGMTALVVSLSAVHWAEYARIVRTLVVTELGRPYVLAATALGVRRCVIAVRHILPNIAHAVIVLVPFSLSWAILSFAGLSYLGLGPAPGAPEWGLMIAEGRAHMREYPRLMLAPGLTIVCLVIALNLLGDHLRARLAPGSDRPRL